MFRSGNRTLNMLDRLSLFVSVRCVAKYSIRKEYQIRQQHNSDSFSKVKAPLPPIFYAFELIRNVIRQLLLLLLLPLFRSLLAVESAKVFCCEFFVAGRIFVARGSLLRLSHPFF